MATKAMMMRKRKGGTAIINDDIALEMERLFDHYNMDHIPISQRLDGFKQRNLPLVKHYKAAVNIFGGPASRKRVIIAPPMETPLKRKLGLYMHVPQYPQAPTLNNCLQPPPPQPKVYNSEEIHDQEEKTKEQNYKEWYAKRQQLRSKLDSMGLSEEYLQRKADKSELEKRVQHRMKEIRTFKPESPPPPQPIVVEKEPPVVPNVKMPVPTSLQTLDQFLMEKKIRLVDLFRNADRNRDWRLDKEELLYAVKKYKIPLSNADVEDLMVALDKNFDELLDFKEITQGLAALKTDRRVSKRLESAKNGESRQPSMSPLSKISPLSRDQMNSNQNSIVQPLSREQTGQTSPIFDHFTAADVGEKEAEQGEEYTRQCSASRSISGSGSAHNASRSSTPSSLELPPPDLREEHRVASSLEEMVELRKHDKVVLERSRKKKWPWSKKRGQNDETPGVIRIGHKAVDCHSLVSTMEGECGELMNHFRRSALKEYFHAVRVCQEKGLTLNVDLLDRVLLYPPEIPSFECRKKLALPKGPLVGLTADFAKPPKKPKTPPEIRHKDKIQMLSNGTLTFDTRHMYPPMAKVAPVATKENLSTGPAFVQRKSDIWMSFEEYDKYTQHLPKRYKKLNIKRKRGSNGSELRSFDFTGYSRYELDEDKFWPGYMLHKLVLYEPGSKTNSGGTSSIFQNTRNHGKPGNLGKVKDTGPPVHPDGSMLRYGIDKQRIIPPKE